jgi:hypothetical protein
MESRSCDVSKYVGLLVQIEKYLQVVRACKWISPKNHWFIIHPWFVNLILNKVLIGFAILWMVFSHKDSSQLLIFINVKICILLKK